MRRQVIRGSNVVKIFNGEMELPAADNTAKALQVYRAANERFPQVPWPKPFHKTSHSSPSVTHAISPRSRTARSIWSSPPPLTGR